MITGSSVPRPRPDRRTHSGDARGSNGLDHGGLAGSPIKRIIGPTNPMIDRGLASSARKRMKAVKPRPSSW